MILHHAAPPGQTQGLKGSKKASRTASPTDVPHWLKRAREEVLLALEAGDEIEARLHQRQARQFMRHALHEMHKAPDLPVEWSGIRPPHISSH